MSSPRIELHWVDASNAGLLERVDDDVFDDAVQPARVNAFVANPANQLVVAVSDDTVVGMASGITYVHPDKPLALFINEVGVSARFHRQGIGRLLMQAMLQRGHALGCHEAWVATEVGNQPARALYEATGGVADDEAAVVYVYPLGTKLASGS
jgi:ribosomal protein S18 acetylase RimI-like enzyme